MGSQELLYRNLPTARNGSGFPWYAGGLRRGRIAFRTPLRVTRSRRTMSLTGAGHSESARHFGGNNRCFMKADEDISGW